MNVRAIWSFIAGDSRWAPLGLAAAVGAAVMLVHTAPAAVPFAAPVFVALIAAGLVASVFERTA